MRRIIMMLLVLFAISLMMPQSGLAQEQEQAAVRVMHASPDAPAVDVFVDGSPTLENVPFFALSSYLSVPAGTYQIDVAPAGAGIGSAVLSGAITVAGGQTYTIAAVNRLENIDVLVIEDSPDTPPSGQARVSIVHTAPDAPAVDIKLAGTDTVLVSDFSFGSSGSLDVNPGTYSFDISPAGSSDVVFTTPELSFISGWSYTLIATGFLTPPDEDVAGFWVQSRVDSIGQ